MREKYDFIRLNIIVDMLTCPGVAAAYELKSGTRTGFSKEEIRIFGEKSGHTVDG